MSPNHFSPEALLSLEQAVPERDLSQLLSDAPSKDLLNLFVEDLSQRALPEVDGNEARAKEAVHTPSSSSSSSQSAQSAITLGLASLAAFLQANVTGPILDSAQAIDAAFVEAYENVTRSQSSTGNETPRIGSFRSLCQRSLDVDGVSPYPYIPHIELFCLARFIIVTGNVLPISEGQPDAENLSWMRLRIHLWHYKLLTQPSLGPGSLYTKSGRFSDVPTLEEAIEKSMIDAEAAVFGARTEAPSPWPKASQILYRLEEANAHIMLGNEARARQALQEATRISGFTYALSGALGKRTRYQMNSYSQLVVLAKSAPDSTDGQGLDEAVPEALPLNDDTLLEKVQFNVAEANGSESTESTLPVQLRDLKPDSQPALRPVDQIILLTEATLKDTFSASDSLTLEEVLPFALRVIEDKGVNWQIYTQALLVRSRIELNRSRTVERGVLQMQAVADQVIVDTQGPPSSGTSESGPTTDVPVIHVTRDGEAIHTADTNKPTSFFPAPKPSESATAEQRLRFVNALASPPRWHLESELAYAWTSIGSLVSALEIFKRLRLWPEVALCLATAAAAGDADGRGAGGDNKARAIVRWRLYEPSSGSSGVDEDENIDIDSLKPNDFCGPERSPPPPNAPRLFCILGDMETDEAHYVRAWEISNHRFARAQRSLGELYLQRKEWTKAREAYKLASTVNRLSPELWSRLGDIELRLGNFPNAAEAFQRAINSANEKAGGEDARTWSNLGSALLSWYREVIAEAKVQKDRQSADEPHDMIADMPSTKRAAELGRTASQLVRDSLNAFKRGATIADSNWKIWDNVITIAASLAPKPALDDVILGVRNVLRIRKDEGALDVEILALLVRETTKEPAPGDAEIYSPPRGSLENKTMSLLEDEVAPIITTNSTCWGLISRLRAWRRDFPGALDASEKAWRTAMGGNSSLSTTSTQQSWLTDAEEWDVVVQRTLELVAAYENYGPSVESVGVSRWKGKARSAIRSVLSKGKESWEGDARWISLQEGLEDLR
ncbi:hypothetical protein GGS20DRAFT_586711 [Poronia punctata]|nr:hypothetical protein GGS20DRAFT_586711 [Poronia punctata]